MNSQRPRLQMPLHWGIRISTFELWGDKLCIYPCVFFSDNKCMVSFQQQIVVIPIPFSNSPTWAQCPAIPLNSDTIYLELLSDHKVNGSVQTATPTPCPDFRCQSKVQIITCASDQPAKNGQFPQSLPGFNILLEWLTVLQKAVYLVKGFQPKMEPEHVTWRISRMCPNETKLKNWDWYAVNAFS